MNSSWNNWTDVAIHNHRNNPWTLTMMTTGHVHHLCGIVMLVILLISVTIVTVIWSLHVLWLVVVSQSVLDIPRSPVILHSMPSLRSNRDIPQVNPHTMEQKENQGLSPAAIQRLRHQPSAEPHNPAAMVNQDTLLGRHRLCHSQYRPPMTLEEILWVVHILPAILNHGPAGDDCFVTYEVHAAYIHGC